MQAVGRCCFQKAVFNVKMHAKRFKAFEVHVNFTRTNLTTARHGNVSTPKTRNQRAQNRNAGTHLTYQLVGRIVLINRVRVDS